MKIREVVVNYRPGNFSISDDAFEMLLNLKDEKSKDNLEEDREREELKKEFLLNKQRYVESLSRDDEDLVKVVKELGEKARSKYCNLRIIKIPFDVEWEISRDEIGREFVSEKHEVWYY